MLGGDVVKKLLILSLVAVCALTFVACANQGTEEQGLQQDFVPSQYVDIGEDFASQEISNTATKNGFELTLYANKATYTVDEEINLRATLEYKGDEDSVTIWHGDPYLTFSITDGRDFQTGGLVMTILTSTELEKGKIYEFDYQKSGGFDTMGPDAEFWREFYQEESLKLPAGTYTVTANGNFHLSEQLRMEEKGPSCNLQIEVTGGVVDLTEQEQEEVVDGACPYSVMYQGVQYVTWAEEIARDAVQNLNQVGEVRSLVPASQMPAEEFQSNVFEVGTKLWVGDGQLLVETEDPDVFWVFRGWVEDGRTLVSDTVVKLGHGAFETAVNLTLDDAQKLQWIIEKGEWIEGTADCLNTCVLSLNGRELYYSSDCGTFNDPAAENGGISLSLDEETRQQVNAILEQYVTYSPH